MVTVGTRWLSRQPDYCAIDLQMELGLDTRLTMTGDINMCLTKPVLSLDPSVAVTLLSREILVVEGDVFPVAVSITNTA